MSLVGSGSKRLSLLGGRTWLWVEQKHRAVGNPLATVNCGLCWIFLHVNLLHAFSTNTVVVTFCFLTFIAVSSELFLSQLVVFAFCLPQKQGSEADCGCLFNGIRIWRISFLKDFDKSEEDLDKQIIVYSWNQKDVLGIFSIPCVSEKRMISSWYSREHCRAWCE